MMPSLKGFVRDCVAKTVYTPNVDVSSELIHSREQNLIMRNKVGSYLFILEVFNFCLEVVVGIQLSIIEQCESGFVFTSVAQKKIKRIRLCAILCP